ncbi:MAG: class I SAM-dependent methyltransferase, partial [Anaerolineales bacterium]
MFCRACGSSTHQILDFGLVPLAGDFRPVGERNDLYPLEIDGCPICGLVQVRQPVPFGVLFGPQYRYLSSTTPSLVRHFREYAMSLPLGEGMSVLEVGCNDGVFLDALRDRGYEAVGVEASSNVAEAAAAKGFAVHQG